MPRLIAFCGLSMGRSAAQTMTMTMMATPTQPKLLEKTDAVASKTRALYEAVVGFGRHLTAEADNLTNQATSLALATQNLR